MSPAHIARRGQAITLTLADELDVSRGCVIEHMSSAEVSRSLRAKLLWMDETDLVPGKNYLFKLGTKTTPGVVREILCGIDVTTGERIPATRISKNELCECSISLGTRIVVESFERSRALGSMILIDRLTNSTAAAGIVEQTLDRSGDLTHSETDITGISSPYEVPERPQMTVDTSVEELEASAERIVAMCESLSRS